MDQYPPSSFCMAGRIAAAGAKGKPNAGIRRPHKIAFIGGSLRHFITTPALPD
jgi:hypothetical protein